MKFTQSTLKCSNEVDQFSVSNNKAKLTYPIGLASVREIGLLYNGSYLLADTNKDYWLSSPSQYNYNYLTGYIVHSTSYFGSREVYFSPGIRPTVSLKPGTEFSSGDGSMDTPYVIDTN